ncbi:MAG: Gfo/Idh/MocA family oxidoreductase [Planctomycetes bacterium]|nr:Gfo/Idh/MocA family oxidoreductase [Planctomycetota bacterium]
MRPIRIAVVGGGHLGKIHTRILQTLPQFQLAGVVEPIAASREAVAQQFKVPVFDRLAAVREQIDAAVVAAPTCTHHDLGLELLNAGLHVFMEKPLAPSHDEASDLVDAARAGRRVLQVGHVERFNPAWSATLGQVRDPKYIEGVRRGPFSFRSTDIGVVLDLMIHDIDLVLSIVHSRVRGVSALGVALFGQQEDIAHARIEFENGCIAQLSASRASHQPARTMQLWSQQAFAAVDFSTRTASIVRPSDEILRHELDVHTLPAEQKAALKDRLLTEHLPVEVLESPPVDAITAELIDFAESVAQGRMPRVSGEHGRNAVAVAEQVLQSIAQHQWDGQADGRVGPLLQPQRLVIPSPHFLSRPASVPADRRAAG